MHFQAKFNFQPYPIYKTWSNGPEEKAQPIGSDQYQKADLVSSCLYESQKNPVLCRLIAFDIDRKDTHPDYKIISYYKHSYGEVIVHHKPVREAIKKAYPGLESFISAITQSRHTGLGLVILFPAFSLLDEKLKMMAMQLQRRIGLMLKAIGIGVDEAAYGLLRDTPNFYNQKISRYRNRSLEYLDSQKAGRVLSRLMEIVNRYKHIWDEGKKSQVDQYFYPDRRVEKKLADFFTHNELEFSHFENQDVLASALGICKKTLKKLIDQSGLSWLRIMPALKGYDVQVLKNEKLQSRAQALMNGSFKDWDMPEAKNVEDGQRNEYIWRCLATMKMQGIDCQDAISYMKILAEDIPGHEVSKNCRRIAKLAHAIYHNQTEYFDRYQACQLKPIPGLDHVIMTQGTKLGNGGGGGSEGHSPKLRLLKNPPALDLSQLKSCVYYAQIDGKGRIKERLLDRDQYQLQSRVYEEYLSPLLEDFFHNSSYGSRPGKGFQASQKQVDQLLKKHESFLKFDVESYFESIDQKILFEKLSLITGREKASFIMGAVTAPRIYHGQKLERPIGIATGSSLSNVLANLYLTDLDFFMQSMGLKFVRLMDDITIFGKPEYLERAFSLICQHLKKLGLRLNDNKTCRGWEVKKPCLSRIW